MAGHHCETMFDTS